MTAAKLLVVDDDPARVLRLRTTLARAGCTQIQESDGGDDLAAMLGSADAVLLDMAMTRAEPLLAWLRRCEDAPPVLAVTPSDDAGARGRALTGGANEVITRPLDEITLAHRLHTVLELREAEVVRRHRAALLEGEVRQRLAEMAWLANHDPLTELPNRAVTLRHLEDLLRENRSGAVLFLTLRGHQRVADACGHEVGEKLLRAVGERISDEIDGRGRVGAWGGGEYVVMLSALPPEETVQSVAAALIATLQAPFEIDGLDLTIWCHIGVSLFPQDGRSASHLIRNASTAMYLGKKARQSDATFFSPRMDEVTARRHTLERELRHALDRGQFQLYYQPKIDLGTGLVIGMEALLRWRHPELGMISPEQFIPLAEETGLILPIGDWVLRRACLDTVAWNQGRSAPLAVAVNLSGRQFDSPDLATAIAGIAHDAGLSPALVELEVTESALMRDAERGRGVLGILRDNGFGIAIDDFGTGYSSLSQLKHLPLTTLKIDRSFVAGVTDSEDDVVIARMIIDMARTLHLRVVAEGIETLPQAQVLRRMRCDQGQGYLYARPLPAAEFGPLFVNPPPPRKSAGA